MSKLPAIYERLVAEARAHDRDAAIDLAGGARLVVRVEPLGGEAAEELEQVTLTIARRQKELGDGEIVTFRRDCGVPPAALRWPRDAAQQRIERGGAFWYTLVLRWAQPTPAAASLAPAAERLEQESAL